MHYYIDYYYNIDYYKDYIILDLAENDLLTWVTYFGSFISLYLQVKEPGIQVGLAVCRTCLASE